MSHALQQRIAGVRSRARRLAALYGASCIVAAVVGAAVLLGAADYLIRFQDPGIRVICTLVVLGVVAWTCYRHLYLPLATQLRDVDVAARLQQRFPQLEDRLLSSVEFLGQAEDDPLAGSAGLRRAVISQTTAEADRLDFHDVLDVRPPLRAAMVTVVLCLVAAILVAVRPSAAAIAVARLANPFGVPWPQRTHLKLHKQVTRVARGQAFEVEVVAEPGTALPEEVRIHYRFEAPDGSVIEETEPMHPASDAVVARRENVVRPFSYRVEGGDDNSMPWVSVEVVEPPQIESLAVRLVPPEYTGWPPERSGRHIRALVGTRIEFEAHTTKPLRSVVFRMDGRRGVPGHVSKDGRRFTLPDPAAGELLVKRSGAYWFELTDRQGLRADSDPRWEIHAVADASPTVVMERPNANVFVTSRASVPLRVMAKDDVGIREITLEFRHARQPEEEPTAKGPMVRTLYQGPDQPPERVDEGAGGGEPGERRVVEYDWELAEIDLRPGMQLTFDAAAGDYRPQTGRSEPRRLIVITTEELQQRLADRQSVILAELKRVLEMQRGSRSQVESLRTRLDEVDQLRQRDVDRLQAAELSQRQVRRSLVSRSEGVVGHIVALLDDLENNRVDSPDTRRRMHTLLSELDRLDREELSVVARQLLAAIKTAQVALQRGDPSPSGRQRPEPSPAEPGLPGPLAQASRGQQEVIATLERLLDQFRQWDDYRRFHREIAQLLREQEELNERTSEVGRITLTKELRDLPPQEMADLKELAGRQLEIARRLDRIQGAMEQARTTLSERDPLAAETLGDALEEARRLAITGQMHSVSGRLERNQMGQAVAGQKQIARHLQEILDILANRRRHELARLLEKLRETEGDLTQIDREQGQLHAKLDECARQPDEGLRRRELQRLGGQQGQLEQRAERIARRLTRLLADQAAQTTRSAAGQMREASQRAGQGDSGGACRGAGAAKRSLEEARRQLAQRRLQAQAELATEQLARLQDALGHLYRRQEKVLQETRRYDGLRKDQGQLSRAQSAGLRDLGRQQRALGTETGQLAEKLVAAPAFELALAGAGRYMKRAAALLDRDQTGPVAQQAEEDALARLAMLLEAFKREGAQQEEPREASGGAGGTGKAPGPGGVGVQTLTALRLLKLMQQEINLRTQRLEEAVGGAEVLSDEQREECVALGKEQDRLADTVLQMLPAEGAAPEDDPAGLPDVPPEQPEDPSLLPLEEPWP